MEDSAGGADEKAALESQLPAGLRHARQHALEGHFAECDSAEAELAVHATRATGLGAATGVSNLGGVTGHRVQFENGLATVFLGQFRIDDFLFQLCAFFRLQAALVSAFYFSCDLTFLGHDGSPIMFERCACISQKPECK